MRGTRIAAAVTLTLLAGTASGAVSGTAVADDHSVPSRHDVRQAREAVQAGAADVATVRARLAVANQRLEDSSIRAARAAEAFNGARWEAHQARAAARDAERRSAIASADVARQRAAYGDALVSSYEMAPGLTALSAIARADGIDTVIERTTSMQNAEDALDGHYDEFRAASVLADVATRQARQARTAAVAAEQRAQAARDAAQAAEDSAAADARTIGDEKAALLTRLAHLQHVSVALATRRQAALEARARAAAAAAAQHQAELEAQQAAQEAAQQAAQQTAQQAAQQAAHQAAHQAQQHHAQQSQQHHQDPPATPSAPPAPPAPPAPAPPVPASGAHGAIAFARAQIGEPYVWGAAGPDAWDCSGLTMGAWRAGGRYLPHYSVAQYEQSTPVPFSDLQPGDLVFWGSSSDPSSIYHVALYLGGGEIIEAPRTGVPVRESSIYAWTLPNFYARP